MKHFNFNKFSPDWLTAHLRVRLVFALLAREGGIGVDGIVLGMWQIPSGENSPLSSSFTAWILGQKKISVNKI